ncbi:hypothetical protein AY606_02245 [Acinetobacter sp. SFB]|uniref:hypothetical protein n=1 Tax=Acinetobacter sp. SFB TaxID=1805634 RepID=UPI0007D82564|nr:hypothetical protein [Acinetobacter sp. SFB]OAL81576.1 hypothetical protein AY606_02245 [Acinetobacter sp. SFB]
MSLNKLKDALQDYQNSYSECLGITPTSSAPTEGRAETNSAFPKLGFKIEIPDPLEINSTQVTQEKVSSVQTEIDKDILQPKRNPFSQYGQNDQPQLANQSNQNSQRIPRARIKKKEGFNFTPILILFVFIMLCGIGYAIYDFYSPNKAVTSLPSQAKMSLNHEIQKENTSELPNQE